MKKYIIISIFVLLIVAVVFIIRKDKSKEYPLEIETTEWRAAVPDTIIYPDLIKEDSLGNNLYYVFLRVGEAVVLNRYLTKKEYYDFLLMNQSCGVLLDVESHNIKIESSPQPQLEIYPQIEDPVGFLSDEPYIDGDVSDFNPSPVISEKTFRSKYVENKVIVYANTFVDSLKARVNVDYELYFNDNIYPIVKENLKKERKKGRIEGILLTTGGIILSYVSLKKLGAFDK